MNDIKVLDIIQVHPRHETFGGCLMMVTEVKEWGVQAEMILPNDSATYARLKWDEFEKVGAKVVWVTGE